MVGRLAGWRVGWLAWTRKNWMGRHTSRHCCEGRFSHHTSTRFFFILFYIFISHLTISYKLATLFSLALVFFFLVRSFLYCFLSADILHILGGWRQRDHVFPFTVFRSPVRAQTCIKVGGCLSKPFYRDGSGPVREDAFLEVDSMPARYSV